MSNPREGERQAAHAHSICEPRSWEETAASEISSRRGSPSSRTWASQRCVRAPTLTPSEIPSDTLKRACGPGSAGPACAQVGKMSARLSYDSRFSKVSARTYACQRARSRGDGSPRLCRSPAASGNRIAAKQRCRVRGYVCARARELAEHRE